MIYLWGYNGFKQINEDSCERYVPKPQKFKSENCPRVSAELAKLQNFETNCDSCIQKSSLLVSPQLSSILTLEDDTPYLIHGNGTCSVFTMGVQRTTTTGTVKVKKGLGMENARFHQVAAGQMHIVGITDNCAAGRILPERHVFRPFSPSIFCKQVSCGKEHTLLLTCEGNVYSFGIGSRGQLGHGITDTQSEPKRVDALEVVSIATISCGGWHSAAVSDIQDLYVWGWNESGQLGFKKPNYKEQEQTGRTTSEQTITISDDSKHNLARGGCEENDDNGVLFHMLPAILDLPSRGNVSKVSCGSRHTAALTDTGHLFTWGWGEYGQLGHGNRATIDTPTQVQYFIHQGLTVTDIYCKDWNTSCICQDNAK